MSLAVKLAHIHRCSVCLNGKYYACVGKLPSATGKRDRSPYG